MSVYIFSEKKKAVIGYGSIFIGIILFSTIEVSSKIVTSSGMILGPFWISTLRFLISAIMFTPAIFFGEKLSLKDFIGIFICSIFSVTIAITFFFHMALMPGFNLSAGLAAIVFCTNPILVALFSPYIAPAHHQGLERLEGAFLAFGGVIIASWPSIAGAESGLIGILLMFTAALLFAAAVPFSKPFIVKYGGMKYLAILFYSGTLSSIIFSIFMEGVPTSAQLTNHLPALLFLCVVGTGIGYFLYFYGFKWVDASKGSQIFFLKPVLAPVVAFLFIGENLSYYLILGVIVILSGVVLAFKPRKSKFINNHKSEPAGN